MADQPKTLEMRVAELEDKLAKLNISEDEMKAYQKVSAALGAGAAPALSPQLCQIQPCHISACIRQQCWGWSECRPACECRPPACSPCVCSTCQACVAGGGGGFGTLGS